jgi:glutaredoxin
MQVEPIRVFWMPGCSACVKAKEFLSGLGVPFEAVNVLDDAQGAADLTRLGARSLPVVARGDTFVFAQSLDQVAEFVGRKYAAKDRLPPDELVRRWSELLAAARALTLQIPPDRLGHCPIPNRRRDLRELSYHIFQIPDVFVRNVAGEFEDWAHHVNLPVPDDVRTTDDIARFADKATKSMTDWWDELVDRDCLWTVATHYGKRPGWELLERQTWHSAQHTRQLQAVLEGFGVRLTRGVAPELYDRLPMPATLWE